MTPDGEAELDKTCAARGYTLPLHDALAEVNPEFLKRYGALASSTLFSPEEGRAMDPKTHFLVLVGVTTAVEGDREGGGWLDQSIAPSRMGE